MQIGSNCLTLKQSFLKDLDEKEQAYKQSKVGNKASPRCPRKPSTAHSGPRFHSIRKGDSIAHSSRSYRNHHPNKAKFNRDLELFDIEANGNTDDLH